jgi:toxin ParE1/3/4
LRVTRSGRAGRDLAEIFDYSAREWGLDQAELYLRQLDMACQNLGTRPRIGAPAENNGPGYRRLPIGRHVIFYRINGGEVLIVRILHQRMDAGRHLPPGTPF